MKKRLKRISLFLGVVVLGVATSVSLFANSPKDAVGVDATNFTNNDIRIPFVGLSWWDDYDSGEGDTIGNEVFIRIVDSDKESSLTNNTVADITYIGVESSSTDTYYNIGEGGFSEYDTSNVLFFDLPYSTISGKKFDLARVNPSDHSIVWNRINLIETFNDGMLHKVWRSYGNEQGIFRPDGSSAESRYISNGTLAGILYGYLSCSPNTHNGYPAFPTLDENFNLTGGRDLTQDSIVLEYDYSSEADYVEGNRAKLDITLTQKVNMMKYMYDENIPSAGVVLFDSKSSIYLIICTALIGLTSIAGLYILKKKRA